MDNTDRTVTINILDWLEEETKQELRKEERADYLKLKTRMVKLKTDAILEMYRSIQESKDDRDKCLEALGKVHLCYRLGFITELWLGTINAPGCDFNRLIFDKWATEDYDFFANTVLADPEALQYISGVSYQWGGKIAMQRTFESWYPRIRLMQSENECGFGDNTWEYARYVWTMLKHYIGNGAESYLYWNFVLEPMGINTWGDPQNAMVTVDPASGEVTYNPDFYVMKHFSSCVKRDSVRLGARGTFAGDSLVFRNPDGSIVLELYNPFARVFTVEFEFESELYRFELEPKSVNSIILK